MRRRLPYCRGHRLSHFEADECGAINELLAVAPLATPVYSRIAGCASAKS